MCGLGIQSGGQLFELSIIASSMLSRHSISQRTAKRVHLLALLPRVRSGFQTDTMARSVLALAAVALVCTCANAQMRATFEQAYSLQQSDLLADTQQLANSVWDLVCINDCTTTTPAQNHSVSADKNIYFNPKFTEATPYDAGLCVVSPHA